MLAQWWDAGKSRVATSDALNLPLKEQEQALELCEIDGVWSCQSGGSVSLGWSLIRAPRGDVMLVILRGKC